MNRYLVALLLTAITTSPAFSQNQNAKTASEFAGPTKDVTYHVILLIESDDQNRIPYDGPARDGLTAAGYDNLDITDNELAKTHIRYMVGGRSSEVVNERIFRFWFPETPGALVRFLDATRGQRNISLFHYRLQGGDFGRVLIGLEFPEGDDPALYERLDKLGYTYFEETDNPAYRLFL